MNLQPKTKKIQNDFATYCRTGEEIQLQGANLQRLKHYRRLVYGVVSDALETAYPIASDFLGDDKWNDLAGEFFSNHKCSSWQVWNIAGELYDYAVKNKLSTKYQIPVLNDLLLFEWAETKMYNMPDKPVTAHKPSGNIFHEVPVLNPEFNIYRFTYPVHLMHPAKALNNPGEYFMLMFRDLQSGNIHFIDLSGWFVWLIEQIWVCNKSPEQCLVSAESMLDVVADEALVKNTMKFLKHLQNRKFIIGFNPTNPSN